MENEISKNLLQDLTNHIDFFPKRNFQRHERNSAYNLII